MEFPRRSNPRSQNTDIIARQPSSTRESDISVIKKNKIEPRWFRMIVVVQLSLISMLVISIAVFTAIGGKRSGESNYIDNNKYQAIFMNRGEVYFGKISDVTPSYLRIVDVYSINQEQTTNGTQQPTDSTSTKNYDLTKIVKGVHCPTDAMIIYKDQVSYWENLQSEGQVVKIIEEYKKQNPNGQTCSAPNQESSPQPQNSSNGSTNTNPATNKKQQ